MKKAILFIIFLFLIIITACKQIDISKLSDEDLERISEKVIVCNSPYIRHATDCCLDQNNNKICDEDEKETKISLEKIETKSSPKEEKYNGCSDDLLENYPLLDDETIKRFNDCNNRESCINSLSLNIPNLRLCNLIPLDKTSIQIYNTDESYFVCIWNVAMFNNDWCVCNRIELPERDGCYANYAVFNNDKEKCNFIVDEYVKTQCFEGKGIK